MSVSIRPATPADVPLVLSFIRDLAVYEHLEDRAVASEADLSRSLFGTPRYAEVVFACSDAEALGFALFFHNFSTFLGKPGIYLEDLFVRPQARGLGLGKALLAFLARTALERGCARLDWAVLDWNAPSIGFYRNLGATALDDWTTYRLSGEALERLAAAHRGTITSGA